MKIIKGGASKGDDIRISHYSSKVRQRCIDVGRYILETRKTVRQVAEVFLVSKSTIHKDTNRLYYIDRDLYYKVKEVMDKNKQERHLRGGMSTKKLWEVRKKNLGI